jgi:uncharacterized membrane protein
VNSAAANSAATMRAAMRVVMAAFFIGGFVLHLTAVDALLAITPDWVPFPQAVVLTTGALELAGGIALLIPRLRWWAGVTLALYVLAVWPANFKHAFGHIGLPPIPDSWWYHGPRLAFQPVLAWWALFCAGVVDWPLRGPGKSS